MIFCDRQEAGRRLAANLAGYGGRHDVIVLGLARGGVPIAAEVAARLGAPLDVFMVRPLSVPWQEELALGLIASGGVGVVSRELVGHLGIPDQVIDGIAAREAREIARCERLYRGSRPAADLAGKTVILVDDGHTTGASIRAAVQALRGRRPARIVVAVPIAPAEGGAQLQAEADEIACALAPSPSARVALWYHAFPETRDGEVQAALAGADRARPPRPLATGTPAQREAALVEAIRRHGTRLRGGASDYDELIERVGDARLVLIGQASHGTHEFYRERATLTKRLITEKGFAAVAIEADWPAAYRVNRFVRGQSRDRRAEDALLDFSRFPAWMWRNAVVADFVSWLRERDQSLPRESAGVGIYGLDLYGLFASTEAIIATMERLDPGAARRVRERYSCLDHFGPVGAATPGFDLDGALEDQVVAMLAERPRHAAEFADAAPLREDEQLFAELNAKVIRNAEAYYRSMLHGQLSCWNLRDRHMFETLDALLGHLDQTSTSGKPAKIVCWAHTSHLGDARATAMGAAGELSLGQLAREKLGPEAWLIGFSTHEGTVTAASEWGAPAERKMVRPALPHSYEAVFHATAVPQLMVMLGEPNEATERLREHRLERAIGVVYRPQTERQSHYFDACLPAQLDVFIYLDDTRAVVPLEGTEIWHKGEVPESYPELP